jgi:hypothetical protein
VSIRSTQLLATASVVDLDVRHRMRTVRGGSEHKTTIARELTVSDTRDRWLE